MLSLLLSALFLYQSPIGFEISLAGNFGEPRPHHFHGGIDIKTDGVEGKAIYSIGDGYVSRVTVGKFGFGNAVYVTHPEGYTSVYCHLKSFSPRIKAAMRRWQYAHQTCEGDAQLSPLDCPVSQGQLIALSGNTGHSTGPHLHLEIHDTETWNMLDPLDFIGDLVNDTVPPQAHSLMACPQQGEGIFNQSTSRQIFPISGHSLTQTFKAWGKVGFALRADDYMQASSNHFGIRETILQVDGQEVFHAVVNDIPVESNRLVNAWGDYDHWLHHRQWYMKSFVEPGNTLSILRAEQRGIIDFSEERDYQLEYILRDFKGNESRYAFTVRGDKSSGEFEVPQQEGGRLFRWNQTNTFSAPGIQLIVPYGLLASDMRLQPMVYPREGGFSDRYSFYPTSYPLISDGEISLYAFTDRVGADEVVRQEYDYTKFYVSADGRYAGGDYQNGWVSGKIRELGATFTLDYDDVPPEVSPVSLGERVVLRLSDAKSGVASFSATIDGQFVVFESADKQPLVICELAETPIRKTNRTHQLRFTATDNRQNTQIYETSIIY
jgi:hypothetical protein